MLPIHCGISRILCIVPEATLRVLFNWASNKINLGVLWFRFTSLCEWSRKRAPLTLIHLDSSLKPVATGPLAFSCALSRLSFLPSQRTRQSGTLTNPLTQDIDGLTRDINGLTRDRPENIPCRTETIARRPETLKNLLQTTTATATRTWQNKRANEQNKSSARAFRNCVHFLGLVYKVGDPR